MLGDVRAVTKPLIAPEEILRLHGKITVDTCDLCYDIVSATKKYCDRVYGSDDHAWKMAIVYTVLFEAGRIQGKREERKRRKGQECGERV